MKTEDPIRVRYLMSPYNLKEVRRAKEWKNMLIGIGFVVIVLLSVAGVMAFLNR